jgi:hypothetical protein
LRLLRQESPSCWDTAVFEAVKTVDRVVMTGVVDREVPEAAVSTFFRFGCSFFFTFDAVGLPEVVVPFFTPFFFAGALASLAVMDTLGGGERLGCGRCASSIGDFSSTLIRPSHTGECTTEGRREKEELEDEAPAGANGVATAAADIRGPMPRDARRRATESYAFCNVLIDAH